MINTKFLKKIHVKKMNWNKLRLPKIHLDKINVKDILFNGKNLSLKGKLITGLLAIMILFLFVAVFSLIQVQQIKSQLQRQNDKVQLKLMALELKEMTQELNIIASGLEISKNKDYIPKYNEKRKQFDQMMKRIGETADTDEKSVWRSKLILLTGEYTNTFDVAAGVIQNTALTKTDVDKNMEYLYNQSQQLMNDIFTYVDQFYASYTKDAETAVQTTNGKLNTTQGMMIASFILVALASAVIGWILIRTFMNPIRQLQIAVQRMADGDLRHKIGSISQDELGQLSQNFDHMIGQISSMLQRTQIIASSLTEHSRSFTEFSGTTASSNQEILHAIGEISAGAEQQAFVSEECSSIIAEMTKEIEEINEFTNIMQKKSREAANRTFSGSESMDSLKTTANQSAAVLNQVNQGMEALSKSSEQIGKIVASITDISSQTNVLALNAAIEAARAGVHGKGFSVIAEEVRKLSAQTNDSSKLIAGIIKSLQSQIGELGANLEEARLSFDKQNSKINESTESFYHIRNSMDDLSGHIEQIHESIAEIKTKNSNLVETIHQVTAIAQSTAAGVEEVNASSVQQDSAIRQIAVQSDDILSLADNLFSEINQFKTSDAA